MLAQDAGSIITLKIANKVIPNYIQKLKPTQYLEKI